MAYKKDTRKKETSMKKVVGRPLTIQVLLRLALFLGHQEQDTKSYYELSFITPDMVVS